MSTKRTLVEAEQAPNTKRQLAQLEVVLATDEEEIRSNKRKAGIADFVEDEPESQKSPKKSIERALKLDTSKIFDLSAEGDVSSSSVSTVVTTSSSADSDAPLTPRQARALAKEAFERNAVAVKVPKTVVNKIENGVEDDIIKPNGSTSNGTAIATSVPAIVVAPLPQAPRSLPVAAPAVEVSTDTHISVPASAPVSVIKPVPKGDEIVRVWGQFFTAMDTCISTVAPIFLSVVLVLYAVSVVTKSQIIASIGLVYVFVFLVIMFSYFFAIVPFILISNAISSLVAPEGKSSQIDFVRVAILFTIIATAAVYLKYGSALL